MKFEKKAHIQRRLAENKLRTGSAPASSSPLDKDTLAHLYRMTTDPERSSDALKILQELQVYQVELDLQRAELENNEQEMARELALYKALFELTPAACLVVTMDGRIVEANPATAALLDAVHDELAGRELIDFLKPECHAVWRELLRKLKAGEQAACCELLVGKAKDEAVSLRLSANVSHEGDALLLTVASREPVLHDHSPPQQAQ